MDLSRRLLLWQQLAESCGVSTLQQGLQQVWKLLLLCLLCRLCFRLGEMIIKPFAQGLCSGSRTEHASCNVHEGTVCQAVCPQ